MKEERGRGLGEQKALPNKGGGGYSLKMMIRLVRAYPGRVPNSVGKMSREEKEKRLLRLGEKSKRKKNKSDVTRYGSKKNSQKTSRGG